jgi:UDP-N-acetylmuramoylalanine--D-glutamate ligase
MTSLDVSGKRVVVAGLGVTGQAVARVLLARNARVVVVDASTGDRQQAAAAELAAAGVEVRVGEPALPAADLVVASPGWRMDNALFKAARAAGIEVIGEPELARRLEEVPTPWLGVTGTNGKTTTVGMLEAVLNAGGMRAVAAGNVGLPLVEAVTTIPSYDALAVEISSQQLAWSPDLGFAAAAILNIADDHLDWHDSLDNYVQAKTRIWSSGVAVANIDDERVRSVLPAGAVTFAVTDRSARYGVDGATLVDRANRERLIAVGELQVVGGHNVSNALAAAALARELGVDAAAVHSGLAGFAPGGHRNTLVDTIGGVAYVDDSKATNPHAAAASLAAYPHVVWVAGGLLKGIDVEPLVAAHHQRLRAVVLIGRDRQLLADALARHAPDVPVVDVGTPDTGAMSQVVQHAAALARPGDTVLLAPSAASWDMFRDYAQRGELFADAVRRLAEQT